MSEIDSLREKYELIKVLAEEGIASCQSGRLMLSEHNDRLNRLFGMMDDIVLDMSTKRYIYEGFRKE